MRRTCHFWITKLDMNPKFIIVCLWILYGNFAAEINAEKIGVKLASRSQNLIEKFCPDCISRDETDVKTSIKTSEQSPEVPESQDRTVMVAVKPGVLPFVERRTDNPGGIFGELLNHLKEYANFTLKYVWLPSDEDIPKFIEGEGQRLAFDLRAIPKHFTHRSKILHTMQNSVWVIARGTDLEQHDILFRPLVNNILLQSALLTIYIAVTMYLSRDLDRTRMMSRLFGMFLGIGVSWLPKKWCLRFLIISWCLGSYIFVQIYFSILTSDLSFANDGTIIQNLNDLVDSGIRIFCNKNMKEFYCDKEGKFETHVCKNCFIMNVSNYREGYFESISMNETWQSYAFNSDSLVFKVNLDRKPFVAIPGLAHTWPSAVYISQKVDLKYLKYLKRYFIKLWEAGFINHWMDRYVPKKIDNDTTAYKPLTMSNMKGAFIVLFVGWACSFVVFIIELSVKRFRAN